MNGAKIAGSIGELTSRLEPLRTSGKKVVLCHGVFDVLHAGHLLHLDAARTYGDILVVTVTPDRYVNKGPGRPAFNERLRVMSVASIDGVDLVAINEWPTAEKTIRALKPHVYVKGQDYADASNDKTGGMEAEAEAVREVAGAIRFTDEETFSSSALVNRFFSPYSKSTQDYLATVRDRYSAEEIIEQLDGFSDIRPLVIGEAILDEYCYTTPLAKAPREAVIAAKFESLETFAGGAVATANHLAGFCREVTLVATVGEDGRHQAAVRAGLSHNVNLVPVVTPDRPTVRKRRYIEPGHLTKLFEIQFLDDTELSAEAEASAAQMLAEHLPAHDLAVVNDFGHGFLTPALRAQITGSNTFLALNTQTNSANLGFNLITKYARASYCCIDQAEGRLAAGLPHGTPAECAAKLMKVLGPRWFMETTGLHGASLIVEGGEVFESPALSPTVVDRVGAGDAFFAVTSPWAYREHPADLAPFIGNCAGAMQVGTVGNRNPVDPVSLYKFITSLMK